ncbi:ankyrin repeat domain-containing protein [Sphaerulina musiva SO2202]|uniref:Ankyrin repeat domain-containing protein n=1 Tax=Sphaerulina musiva (strain SO2202) TaxID=692275 RepID=N1QKB5_SPHMS|nr:ankyrin repeat domain-containing protein [Sphaerulina musiva SO2202]EMF16707.1 ankyrin repeat domain-containing protein [Sphaerulina musiva SO2202]
MADDEGASPKELLLEACRRNNTTLLSEVFEGSPLNSNADAIAAFLNTSTDALGASALHVAAHFGSYEVLDAILDQEGVEIDGQDRREGDTPLHSAVRFSNGLSTEERDRGQAVVDILVDAGCDPRIRNKAKLKPIDLVDPRNTDLRAALQKAELAILASSDLVNEDEDDGPDGPGSESD